MEIQKLKYQLIYFATFLFTSAVTFFLAFFPPVFAMCEYTYNYLKSAMMFPGSLIASVLIMILTIRNKGDNSFFKKYLKNLALVAIPFSLISFSLLPLSDMLDSHGMSINISRRNIVVPSPINYTK